MRRGGKRGEGKGGKWMSLLHGANLWRQPEKRTQNEGGGGEKKNTNKSTEQRVHKRESQLPQSPGSPEKENLTKIKIMLKGAVEFESVCIEKHIRKQTHRGIKTSNLQDEI